MFLLRPLGDNFKRLLDAFLFLGIISFLRVHNADMV